MTTVARIELEAAAADVVVVRGRLQRVSALSGRAALHWKDRPPVVLERAAHAPRASVRQEARGSDAPFGHGDQTHPLGTGIGARVTIAFGG